MANRLEKEDSPYLQQHKNNPVDWWPWCDEAFEKAQKENKAIFISIGYSSCHWCHVMEEKVFENEECAQILNENFISIKVDREERPDIDKHYQEVYQLLNRRAGGWPTSIFCTPQNKPFFAGTYIPPEAHTGDVEGMGFKDLTSLIAQKIEENDPKLYENADEVENFIKHVEHPKEATVLKAEFYLTFINQAKSNFQPKYGGFSVEPKFPHASTLKALQVIDNLYDDKAIQAMITHTLDEMKKGGMYDLVDGGFCRYSVDEKWLVPHFEKMLYDNALLCSNYLEAYLAYKDEKYLHTAKEIADFWFNHMSEENLFYSASDADSEGEEGTYFTYTYEEVYDLLTQHGYDEPGAMCEKMNVTLQGNFEGKNIIRFDNEVPTWFADVKKLLQSIRGKRAYPFIDRKVQTSWSAMMIYSLFQLSSVDGSYETKAIEALDALLAKMFVNGTLYHTSLPEKTPKVEAFLEDYAFLAKALLSAYKITQDEYYLIQAQRMANKALENFYEKGLWNFSVGEFKTKAEVTDNTYTSSVSIIVDVLLTLGMLLEDEKYTHFAFKTMEYNSYDLGRRPIYYPYMMIQALRYIKGDRIVKSTLTNLKENRSKLGAISYPFTILKSSDDKDFMICGEKSCFANTSDIDQIDELIQKSL
ncbi:thioredoxin domain-containing protein [Sulfurimonas sp. C5]|uniref:thioredoxin domain-containing protein n=1 Tax=Sulfurimonas sp. C5 TaxID=3036947 RepID=UPI0024540A7E|nr:thioredoxin domain-containing protein [Sulfurimonas sp. C5]MDH4943727.1 thioredoxin domain-containing protein [Sulfurimonas sp. C5]